MTTQYYNSFEYENELVPRKQSNCEKCKSLVPKDRFFFCLEHETEVYEPRNAGCPKRELKKLEGKIKWKN